MTLNPKPQTRNPARNPEPIAAQAEEREQSLEKALEEEKARKAFRV